MTMLLPLWLFAYLAIGSLLIAGAVASSPRDWLSEYPRPVVVLALIIATMLWPVAFIFSKRGK